MMNWFHGTNCVFTKPTAEDIAKHSFKGEGLQRYGCGLYLNDRRDVADYYAQLDPAGTPTIYEARVSTTAFIVDWGGFVSEEIYEKLARSSLPQREKDEIAQDREQYAAEGLSYSSLYGILAAVLDDINFRYDKRPAVNTSKFFVEQLGISGAQQEDSVHGGMDLVLFDLSRLVSWQVA